VAGTPPGGTLPGHPAPSQWLGQHCRAAGALGRKSRISQLEGARHHHGDSATSPSPWLGRCRAAPFPGTRLPRSGSDSIAALQGAGGMLALLGGPHGGSTYW